MSKMKSIIFASLSLVLVLVGCGKEASLTVDSQNEQNVVEEEINSTNAKEAEEITNESNESPGVSGAQEKAKVVITYDPITHLFYFNGITFGTTSATMNQLLGAPTLIEEELEQGEYYRYYYDFETKFEESLLFHDYGGDYNITSVKYETIDSNIGNILSSDFIENFEGEIYHFTGDLFQDKNTLNGWAFLNDTYFLQITEIKDYNNPEKIYYSYSMSESWQLYGQEEQYTLINKEALEQNFKEYFFN